MISLALAVAILSPSATLQSTNIDSYVQNNLKDASWTARVVTGNQAELRKINADFGLAYKFDYAKVKIKDPFMLRVESTVEDQTVLAINNGTNLLYSVPRSHISKKEPVAHQPGRRQTFLDFGLLVPSLFDGFFQAKFVRQDRATNEPVFDLTFPKDPVRGDTSRQRIWIDPSKKVITKREWYNQQGVLLATFFYEKYKEVNGIWLPSFAEVRNAEDKVAGQTKWENLTANTGLADSLFTIN